MPLVRIVRNYKYPAIFRQTPGSLGVWKNFEFTEEDVEEADYLVVLNYPLQDVKCTIRKGGALLLVQEPPFERNQYNAAYFPFFDKVVSHLKNSKTKVIHEQAGLPWHLEMDYDQLNQWHQVSPEERIDHVSWITSNLNIFPTHQLRHNFIHHLQKTDIPFVLFGRGFQPINDKMEVLRFSKYTIAAENYIGVDYWTEKLQDAILSWNIPFYYGCKNIEKYLPENAILKIDLQQPEHSEHIIRKAFQDRHWDRHIAELAEARIKILNQLQFFPRVVGLLENMNSTASKKQYFIPSDPFKKSIFQKLISKLKP
jgi:hypothetical protein